MCTDTPTILCIDDDPDISETISLRLRKYDVDVLRAFHGMHGLWLAKTQHPDLIVTDMHMPQGAGDYIIEVLRASRDTAHIPIVVLTGQHDSAGTSKMLTRFNVEGYLKKPVMFAQLEATIQKFVPLHERFGCDAGIDT